MYKLCVFVNFKAKEPLKNALFKAGAGKIGNYDSCSFETEGTGQFRALKGANPTLGSIDNLEIVKEVKIEMVVEEKHLSNVLKALKESHPYETPAYDVIKLVNF